MITKRTSKNQITLPKAALAQVADTEYFEVSVADGKIVLTPVKIQRADAVREKLEALGIVEADVADAVRWARGARA